MKFRALIVLTALATLSPLVGNAEPFGVASAYNLVALGYGTTAGNINDDKDVTGRLAAAGTIFGHSIDTGSGLGGNDPYGSAATIGGTSYSIVAAGGLSGNIKIEGNGSAYALGATNGQVEFHGTGGLVNSGNSPIDFDTLRTQLDSESTYLSLLTQTGTICQANCPGVNPQWKVLVGTNPGLNVFTVSGSDLDSYQYDISVPAGATVLINVDGTADTLFKSFAINGSQSGDSSSVLVNFYEATSVYGASEFDASILAPFATVSGGSDFDGNIIAAAIGSTGEIHNVEFDGTIPYPPTTPNNPNNPNTPNTPAVPEPGTLALVGTGMLSLAGEVRRRMAVRS